MISQESTTKDVKLFNYDFRGHTRGTLVVGIANGYSYTSVQRFFHLFFFVPQVKNRLFPRKPLPLYNPLRFVQFGQESCPAGEYLHSERLWMLEKVSAAL